MRSENRLILRAKLHFMFLICQSVRVENCSRPHHGAYQCHYQEELMFPLLKCRICNLPQTKNRRTKHIKIWNMSFLRSKLLFSAPLENCNFKSHSHPLLQYLPIINVKIIPSWNLIFPASHLPPSPHPNCIWIFLRLKLFLWDAVNY